MSLDEDKGGVSQKTRPEPNKMYRRSRSGLNVRQSRSGLNVRQESRDYSSHPEGSSDTRCPNNVCPMSDQLTSHYKHGNIPTETSGGRLLGRSRRSRAQRTYRRHTPDPASDRVVFKAVVSPLPPSVGNSGTR